jgi:hypothetical protein
MGLEQWESAYTSHPVWAQASALGDMLDRGPEPVDDNEAAHYDRLRWLQAQLVDVAENPSLLVSSSALTQLHNTLNQVTSTLANWVNGSGGTYLVNAATGLTDNVLDALRGWPATKDRYQRGLLRAGVEFQKSAETLIAELQQRVRDQADELARDRATFEERVQNLENASQEVLEELRAKVEAAGNEITTQTGRLDAALNGLQATFSQAENDRAAAHTAALDQQKTAAREAADAAKQGAAAQLAEIGSNADQELARLAQLKGQAEKLVDAIGLTGTATEYGSYATQERKAANGWRYVAVGGFLAAFALFLVTLWKSHVDGGTPWQVVVFKLAGSIALLALGAYAGHESRDHRREERRAKSVQLDLAALDPFIATLDDTEQHDIKAAAARRLFTQPLPPAAGPDGDHATDPTAGLPGTTPAEILSQIRDLVTKVR